MPVDAPPRSRVSIPRWSSPVTRAEMSAGDGGHKIEWVQRHCRIDKDSLGGQRGELIRLRDWQQLQTHRIFARRADGHRKHRVGLLGLPRKNGKSGYGSGIALSEADDGPPGGEVYCCAGDKDQARIVFRTAKSMVEMDPDLSARVKVYRDEMIWPDTETRFRVLSAEAFTKEGLNPTFVLFDEVHVQPDDELWNVMALASGARTEPMMLGITTAGDPVDRFGNDSLCHRLYQHGTRVSTGEVDDPSFYFAWWEPTDGQQADHRDPEVWAESNPALGDLVSVEDFESSVVRTPEPEFRTKRTNIWVRGRTTAVPTGRWEDRGIDQADDVATIRFGVPDDAPDGLGRHVPADWLNDSVLFLDGSWSGDSTGAVGCTRDGHMFTVIHEERDLTDGPEWRVPVSSVTADVRRAFDLGRVRGLLGDPHRWQHTMSELQDEGYPVVEWPTNSLDRIVPAWKDFYAAIMDGEVTHDGDPALVRHMANVVLKVDARGARPVKTPGTRRHIDLAICAIGAWTNRHLDFTDDAPKRAPIWSASI